MFFVLCLLFFVWQLNATDTIRANVYSIEDTGYTTTVETSPSNIPSAKQRIQTRRRDEEVIAE